VTYAQIEFVPTIPFVGTVSTVQKKEEQSLRFAATRNARYTKFPRMMD